MGLTDLFLVSRLRIEGRRPNEVVKDGIAIKVTAKVSDAEVVVTIVVVVVVVVVVVRRWWW